jgi:hypothetical protein
MHQRVKACSCVANAFAVAALRYFPVTGIGSDCGNLVRFALTGDPAANSTVPD